MPCTYTGSLDGDRIMDLEEAAKYHKADLDTAASQIKKLKRERDEMTALACRAFHQLDQTFNISRMNDTDRAWWKRHKRADARKLKRVTRK